MNLNLRVFQRNRNSQSGLAALEFIICFPVLFMLAALLIDVGRAFIQYTEINKALQNGVRYAVVGVYGTLGSTAIANETEIKNMVVYGKAMPADTDSKLIKHIDTDQVVVTHPTVDNKEVTLSVDYTYSPIFNKLPFTETSLAFTIGASTKMRTAP